MIEDQLSALILEAVASASEVLGMEKPPDHVEITRPERKEFGDFPVQASELRIADPSPEGIRGQLQALRARLTA